MILKNIKLGISISIDSKLLEVLQTLGEKHLPNEFGGILVGYYSNDSRLLTITETILPTKFKSSLYSFQRDTTGAEEELQALYSMKPQQYYVGEWHTHPNASPIPSGIDINAMNSIISSKKVVILNPVLLIIGYSNGLAEYQFYVAVNNKLYKYE